MTSFDKLPRGLPGTSTYMRGASAAPRALWIDPKLIEESEYWRYETGKVFLGRSGDQFIGLGDDRHLLTVAGSRAGKGRAAIIPNLYLYPGSVLVLDPKGENARKTAQHRADVLGQDVYVIDPYNVSGKQEDENDKDRPYVPERLKAGYNPLSQLDIKDDFFVDDCATLADGLVVSQAKESNNHWNSSARLILRGLIAFVMLNEEINDKSLMSVLTLLKQQGISREEDGFKGVCREIMSFPPEEYEAPQEMASLLLSAGENEFGSLLSTVRQNVAFASPKPMAACLSGAERTPKLSEWKFRPTSIYLCLPAHLLHSHGRFFRLFLNQLMAAVERHPKPPDIPALMLLDEMHVLGRMSMLETAAGLFAGYGVRIWSFWQDLAQLMALYEKRWQTFVGNAGLIQAFGANDLETLQYLSNRLGGSSILSIAQGEISKDQASMGYSGQSKSIQQSPLLSPDEVAYFFSRQSGNQLLIYPGAGPIFMERQNHDDPRFQALIDVSTATD